MGKLFQPFTNIEDIEQFIQSNQLAFIYVSRENCSVCYGLLPQVKEMFTKYPKVKTALVDADKVPAFTGQYTVFSVPALLLFVNGKEFLREAQIVPMQPFEEKVSRIYEHVVNS